MNYKILLYQHKKYTDGRHPVILQLIHKGNIKRISLGHRARANDWDFDANRFKKSVKGHQRKNLSLNIADQRAESIRIELYNQGIPFTMGAFERAWNARESGSSEDVFRYFERRVEYFEQRDQAGNASVYKEAGRVLKEFHGRDKMTFAELSAETLKRFDEFLRAKGRTNGGVSVFMRTIRALVNSAIKESVIPAGLYPFETPQNYGYKIGDLTSSYRPKYLSREDIEKIKTFPANEYPHLKESWLFFLFSYYGRGIVFTDMARLKWSDVYNGRVSYLRKKTQRKKKKPIPATFPVDGKTSEILDHFRGGNSMYVFPILGDFHKTEKQKLDRIAKRRKKYNSDLKEIANILEIKINITSYLARHSYAMALRNGNVPVDQIAQLMNHSSVETTKSYLDQFPDEKLDETDKLL